MAQITEINNVDELDRYQLLWKALQGETRGSTFIQSLHYLELYWQYFGNDQQLRVLVAHGSGEPIGLLPLVQRNYVTRMGTTRVLSYPLPERSAEGSMGYGPIGPNPAATLVCAMRYLSVLRDWDLLDLRWIPADVDRGRVQLALNIAGMNHPDQNAQTTSVIDLEGTWSGFLRLRGPTWRNRLARAQLNTGEESLSYERYRPRGSMFAEDDPRWELFDEWAELKRRCQPTSTNTTRDQASGDQFQCDLHMLAARDGALDMNLLRCGGQLLAASYGYHRDGIVHVMQIQVEPRFASLDPGMLLLTRMVRDSFQRHDRRVDLVGAKSDIGQLWQTRTVTRERFRVYSPSSLRGQLRKYLGLARKSEST